ncbi:hypothetical protein CSHISOI_05144 [Colletotrichum shisoi]|uniref:Uncharacterized protein n=1 Tax=Colletotrichum shisoi TaxID=2078593 RepID=A0A5Q4BTD3_9PEZI|nr:hypothetical protein CSHISOI_05144 [Colletotrichum shisoi]
MAFATAVAAQQDPVQAFNAAVDISSCQVLSCSPPATATSVQRRTWPGPEVGVGIAAEDVITPSTNISLTLIDGLRANGFTGIGSEAYEFSDQQLFVGGGPKSEQRRLPFRLSPDDAVARTDLPA